MNNTITVTQWQTKTNSDSMDMYPIKDLELNKPYFYQYQELVTFTKKDGTTGSYHKVKAATAEGTRITSVSDDDEGIWSSSVLDKELKDILPGTPIRLTYKGLGKTKAGKNFHNVEVALITTNI